MTDIILTQYDGAILGPIAKLLGWIMNGVYLFLSKMGIENIGLSIIVLTIVIYTCMLPLTIKQQKFSIMSRKMNPELQAIQKKYQGKMCWILAAVQEEIRNIFCKQGYM